jgi:hypothetical protein
MYTEPLENLRNYRWLRIIYMKPLDVLRNYQWFCTMCTEPLEHLRNYGWLCKTYTEPLNVLRNCQRFFIKHTKLPKVQYTMQGTSKGSVVKLRNPLKCSELKKVLYENDETIFMPRNLKSFRKTVRNLQSSVEKLLFLQ